MYIIDIIIQLIVLSIGTSIIINKNMNEKGNLISIDIMNELKF